MRRIVTVCLFALLFCLGASAGRAKTREVASAELQLTIPTGWQADENKLLSCDPERLLVVSSVPIRTAHTGGLLPPRPGQVLIMLVEDYVNLPEGNLQRPAHFTVAWNQLSRLEGTCAGPHSPAATHFFHTHDRYLGFIVFPGPGLSAKTRAQTLETMESLRVTGQFILP